MKVLILLLRSEGTRKTVPKIGFYFFPLQFLRVILVNLTKIDASCEAHAFCSSDFNRRLSFTLFEPFLVREYSIKKKKNWRAKWHSLKV